MEVRGLFGIWTFCYITLAYLIVSKIELGRLINELGFVAFFIFKISFFNLMFSAVFLRCMFLISFYNKKENTRHTPSFIVVHILLSLVKKWAQFSGQNALTVRPEQPRILHTCQTKNVEIFAVSRIIHFFSCYCFGY